VRYRLTGRRQFAAVRAARIAAVSGGLRVHVAPSGLPAARLGFVIPKAAGGAVLRNRVRRRLRAALEPRRAELAGLDVIVVASSAAVATQPFEQLCADLAACLARTVPQARSRVRTGGDNAGPAPLAENGAIRPGQRRAPAPTLA
jgi:ribonuclease P protein component